MSDVFISYSRHDKDIVFPFVKSIERKIGAVCWIDLEGIESGSQFEDVIVAAIDASRVVLFMLSDHSLESKWTKREVLYAEGEGKRIVPVVVDGKGLRKWFKFHFGNVDYVDINNQEQKDKLCMNLTTWLGVKRPTGTSRIQPRIQLRQNLNISADGRELKLNVIEDFDLVLKMDAEKGCYIGEIPVYWIILRLNELGQLGRIKLLVCKYFPTYFYDNVSETDKLKINKGFYSIIDGLNEKYGILVRKKYSEISDFMVKLYLN